MTKKILAVLITSAILALVAAQLLPTENSTSNADTRIVFGENAVPHSAPWVVAIQWIILTQTRLVCGGAILSPQWVVTSAYCLKSVLPIGRIELTAGRHDLSKIESTEQRRIIDRTYVHPNYSIPGTGPNDIPVNDLALIHLKEPLIFNAAVNAVLLPAYDYMYENTSARLVGWGSKTMGVVPDYPNILQTINLPIMYIKVCMFDWILGGKVWNETHLCTGPLSGTRAPCNGDMGAPLTNKTILVGVTSWAPFPCAPANMPSAYVRVTKYVHWLKSMING